MHILKNGWTYTKEPPSLEYPAEIRKRMFHELMKCSFISFKNWKKFHARHAYSTMPAQSAVDDMNTGPFHFQRIVKLALSLDGEDDRPQAPPMGPKTRQPISKPHRDIFHQIQTSDPDIRHPVTMIEDPDFDEYTTAPAVSNAPDTIPDTWTFNQDGLQLDTCWSKWKDRGFRLKPYFFSMFPKDTTASDPSAHFLACPKQHDEDASEESSSSSAWDGSDPSRSNHQHQTNDNRGLDNLNTVPFGLQDMLDEAGPLAKTINSTDVFLRGRERSGRFIQVEPERDAFPVSPGSISAKADIDSLIYVTPRVQFPHGFNLFLLPLHDHRPPFQKSNHVTVQVLNPPTQESKDAGEVSTTEKSYDLSQIPHMNFGYVGEGECRFNTFIFFTRMIHKSPYNGRMQTLIPQPVQEMWLSEVVIPALNVVLGEVLGTGEYTPCSLEELKLRIGSSRKSHAMVLEKKSLSQLQDVMTRIVKSKPRLLARFGSFFFVVDSRGFKMLSKQYPLEEDPHETLCRMFPSLDLEAMIDRKQGELILDLGISFHVDTKETPLIGLWKLPQLERSYKAVGSRKPTKHHASTLLSAGGMQGIMRKSTRQNTHLISRLTYNLIFQVVRSAGCQDYLCKESNAIKGDAKFVEACARWKELFRIAQNKSYGVREELRGSAHAILQLLRISGQKVCDSHMKKHMKENY